MDIALDPLTQADSRHLLGNLLFVEQLPESVRELILARAEGNPFFVNQFLTSLHTRQLLTFSADAGRWQWSLQRIQESSITEDVAGRCVEYARDVYRADRASFEVSELLGSHRLSQV